MGLCRGNAGRWAHCGPSAAALPPDCGPPEPRPMATRAREGTAVQHPRASCERGQLLGPGSLAPPPWPKGRNTGDHRQLTGSRHP